MLRQTLLVLIGLLVLAGCNNNDDCSSDRVACYSKEGNWQGDFCPSTEAPLCGCRNKDGDLIEKTEFELPCENYGTVTGGENDVNIKEPYTSNHCLVFPDQICVDFATRDLNTGLYFDYTPQSNDEFYRPVYVSFGINHFDTKKYQYKIKVTDESTNKVVSSSIINLENTNLRNLEFTPKSCNGDNCIVYGIMSLNINYLSQESTQPTVGLYKTPLDEDGIPTQLDELINSQTVRKFNKALDYESFDRALEVITYETDRIKIENYVTGEGVGFLDAIEKTFGKGKSNLGIAIRKGAILPKQYLDAHEGYTATQELLVLDSKFFEDKDNPRAEEFKKAVHDWVRQVYERSFPEIKNNKHIKDLNSTFTIEVDYFSVYDLGGVEPKNLISPEAFMASLFTIGEGSAAGVTYSDQENYIGALVIGYNNHHNEVTSETKPSRRAFALSTWLHEIGHVWSKQGFKDNELSGCDQHTYNCSGYNKEICLWKTSCLSGKTQAEKNTYFLAKANTPIFCERHQYIFTNGLTIRN